MVYDSRSQSIKKLRHYIVSDEKFNQVYEYTKKRFDAAANLTAHNWEHIYRDTINAIVIGEAEAADMSVVLPAIVCHDIGFLYGATGHTHGAVGAEKLSDYLRDGNITYSQNVISQIADCIRTHKGSMHNEQPKTLEAKVVADADLLEKFGPFGVYQFIRTHTEFNSSLDVILKRGDEIANLTPETKTGQELAEAGREFAVDFFRELNKANKPYQV